MHPLPYLCFVKSDLPTNPATPDIPLQALSHEGRWVEAEFLMPTNPYP